MKRRVRKGSRVSIKPLGWRKTDSQSKRRQAALDSRNGNDLQAARALQQIANRHLDHETCRKARTDAKYFFIRHRLKMQRNGH